jgi:hypothetical protein
MAILDKLTWIDGSALTQFILSAQVRRVHPPTFLLVLSCSIMFFLFFVLLLGIDRTYV